jgi:hypothetical protein
MFSFDGRIAQDLALVSPQVTCARPSSCEPANEGHAEGGEPGAVGSSCVECAVSECGVGCAPCAAGQTCVSGYCVAAGACRLQAERWNEKDGSGISHYDESGLILQRGSPEQCQDHGHIQFFAYLNAGFRIGDPCFESYFTYDADGECIYSSAFEALSK